MVRRGPAGAAGVSPRACPTPSARIGLQLVELPARAVERGRPERPSVPCLDQARVQLDASTAAGRDNGQERVSVQLPTDFRDGPGRGSILLHGAWREDLNRLALREVAVHGGEETVDDIAGVGAELVLEGEEGHQSNLPRRRGRPPPPRDAAGCDGQTYGGCGRQRPRSSAVTRRRLFVERRRAGRFAKGSRAA